MDEYTPSTEEVREAYAHEADSIGEVQYRPENHAEFDRWLAEHDRAVAANAWDEGFTSGQVDMLRHEVSTPEDPCTPNPYRITEENN